MQEKWLKPMGFGRILDRSLQIYRNLFVKLLLLVLILYSPFYLLEGIFYSSSMSNSTLDFSKISESFSNPAEPPVIDYSQVILYILLFLVIGVIMLALFPVSMAAILFMVEAVNKGKAIGIKEALGRSFKRFWALLGSSILYLIILSGIFVIFGIGLLIVAFLIVAAGVKVLSLEAVQNPASVVGLVIGIIVLYGLIYLLLGFFAIRWGFYLPFVALKEDGVGIGRSWNATKGSFWRIFAVFFTSTVITYALVLIASLLLGLMPGSILKAVILVLINVIVGPLILVVYAVTFFDLKVRTEGSDLESMLKNSNFPTNINDQVGSIEGNA